MKNSLLLLFTVFFCFSNKLYSQSSQQMLGVLFENGNLFNNSTGVGVGIMYKKSKKTNRAIRLYSSYSQIAKTYSPYKYSVSGDTLVENGLSNTFHKFNIGAGKELQRQFYKRVFFYAAIDARLGYATGKYKEYETQIIYANGKSNRTQFHTANFNNCNEYSLDIIPCLGAKIVSKRVEIGLESLLIAHHALLANWTTGTWQSANIFDFDISFGRFRLTALYSL